MYRMHTYLKFCAPQYGLLLFKCFHFKHLAQIKKFVHICLHKVLDHWVVSYTLLIRTHIFMATQQDSQLL